MKTLKEEKAVYLTHPDMTRFWIHIRDAVSFMLRGYNSNFESVQIPKMGAARVLRVAELIAEIKGIENYKINYIGVRPGEKIHECLESNHDYCVRSDMPQYQLADTDLYRMLREVL